MSTQIYTASVYSRKVSYTNFKGEEKTIELFFALNPITLMEIIASNAPKKSRSANPAKAGKDEEMSSEEQLKFFQDLACRAAGFPSDDGETWERFEDFKDQIVGQAFLTKLASSDSDRREFAEKVILDPFRAFVSFAQADESNSPAEKQQFGVYLAQMENIFKMPDPSKETREERAARLEAELKALNVASED